MSRRRWAICETDGRVRFFILTANENTAYNQVRGDQLFIETNVDEPIAAQTHYYNLTLNTFQLKDDFPSIGQAVETITGGYRITLTQIPVGTWVVWPDGAVTLENDGFLEAEVEFPGNYWFEMEHPRYLEYTEIVDVQP